MSLMETGGLAGHGTGSRRVEILRRAGPQAAAGGVRGGLRGGGRRPHASRGGARVAARAAAHLE